MREQVFTKKEVKEFRRLNRNPMPTPERKLWRYLRKHQMLGQRVLRQYSIDRHIVDFYCPALKLAIEVDGYHHKLEDVAKFDEWRTKHIETYEISVIRFSNDEVLYNINSVLKTIEHEIQGRAR